MEKALQRRLRMDDAVFQKFWAKYGKNIKITGDILLVWADRAWHPKTKQEIYAFLGVCKELNVCLPQLVVELIAYFIQQAKVFKDYRNDTIEIVTDWHDMDFNTAQYVSQKYCPGIRAYFGGWDREAEITLYARMEKEFLPEQLFVWMKKLVTNWDRYRVPHYWRNRFAKLCGLPRTTQPQGLARSWCKTTWQSKKINV